MANTSTESIAQLQTTPYDELLRQIQRGERDADLRAVFGNKLAEELQGLATPRGLAMGPDRPLVVLLPGIMGSTLHNTIGDTGLIWIDPLRIIRGKLRLLTLNEEGASLVSATGITPLDLVAMFYLPMRIHLGTFAGCDVEVFPYDWRFPASVAAERLRTFVEALFDRERRPVHLVGHSMGGLVAREYCLRYPDEVASRVAQVIMIGPPNAGSVEAVRNLTVGGNLLRLVGHLTSSDTALQFIRSIPGIYSLLPAPQAGYPAGALRPYPFESRFDLYNADIYRIEGISVRHLAATRADSIQPAAALPVPTTIIAGVGVPTCYGVDLRFGSDERPTFNFDSYITNEGDGTVTLASAMALPEATFYFVRTGRHSDLPLYPNVRQAVQMLLFGDAADLSQTFERGLMDAPGDAEQAVVPTTPLPGTLNDAELQAVAARVKAGQASPEDIALLTRAW